MVSAQSDAQVSFNSQKSTEINLALRQTAHLLYNACGDSHSQIPAVEQVSETEFLLKLENGFDYDLLPVTLDGALKNFGISVPYVVSILTCESKEIILGYNDISFNNQVVACTSREQDELCSIISFRIREVELIKKKSKYTLFYFLLIGAIPLIVVFIKRRKANPLYLIQNKNEILKRVDIQNHVWEEEGVIVGRSLDVFISRLRKIIKEDESLTIKNIHGVGYRLEESFSK